MKKFFIPYFIFLLPSLLFAGDVYVDGQSNEGHIIQGNNTTTAQQPILNFSNAFTVSPSGSKTNIGFNSTAAELDPLAWLEATNQIGLTGDKSGSFNLTTTGTLSSGAITGTSFIIGVNSLNTSEWAYLDDINQALKTIDSPTFININVTDTAYAAGWDGNNTVPTKNSLWDKIETIAGGAQTPWAQDIDGAGYNLTNVNNITALNFIGNITESDPTVNTSAEIVAIIGASVYEPYGVAVTDITDASANGRSLISAANYAAMKTLLDLEIGTDIQAYNANLTGINQALATTSGPTFANVTVTGLSGIVKTTTGKLGNATADVDYLVTLAKDLVTTSPLAGGTDNIFPGADADITLSIDNIAYTLLADGTDGNLITWDANGAPALVATGNSGQVLTSGGAGTAPTFANATGGTVTYSKSFVITNPTSSADFALWRSPANITITGVHGVQVGGSNITGQITECDGNGANCVVVDSSDLTITTSNVNDDASLSNPSIDINDYVGWNTTSVNGTVSRMIGTFDYTIN